MVEQLRVTRLFLWANSGCNARCRMCSIWGERAGKLLSAAEVGTMVPEWARIGIKRVILCGEPLMHPEFEAICLAIRGGTIKLDVLTNGFLLEKHAEVVARSCEVLQVSLDGPPEVHNRTRGRHDAFDRLSRGIARLRAIGSRVEVDARCAVHRLNCRHLRATVAAARSIGVRTLSFSGTDLHNEEAFRRAGQLTPGYVSELRPDSADLSALTTEVEGLIEQHAADFERGFLSDSPADLRRGLVDYYRAMIGETPMPIPQCNAPWTSVVVEYDGTVRPCFPMSAYGNLANSGSLTAVINSPRARAHRAALDVATDPTCLNCVCQTVITERAVHHWKNDPQAPSWTTWVRP